MPTALVALAIGLVLLIIAASLFWRAAQNQGRNQTRGVDRGEAARSGDVRSRAQSGWGTAPPAGAVADPAAEPAPESEATPPAETAAPAASDAPTEVIAAATIPETPEAPESTENAGTEDSPEPEEPAKTTDSPETAEVAEPAADEPAESPSSSDTTEPVPASTGPAKSMSDKPEKSVTSSSHEPSGLFAGRRSRRQWAQSHGYEYAKEDRYLPSEWPVSLVSKLGTSEGPTAARDLVSGFIDGHQFHVAEVHGITVLAMRRDAFSPVAVHLAVGTDAPTGMRRSELCDRPPFISFSSDNRALDRMLDSRADTALAALGGVANAIAFGGSWVALSLNRKSDPPVWDHVLKQLVRLVAASRVLPPRVTSEQLDMSAADQTRPRARRIIAETPEGSYGHLRVVPDIDSGTDTEPDTTAPDTTDTSSRERPRVERSSTPVDYPTRSETQTMGDTSDWSEQGVGDVTEDVPPIPAVGEDPDHSLGGSAGGPQVIRDNAHESTIFDEPAADSDSAANAAAHWTPQAAERASHQLPSRGRHRAPDARHARTNDNDDTAAASDGDDYPVVDAEVVDPDAPDGPEQR